MIDLDQNITIKWIRATKKYYESLGYVFTNYDDDLIIKVRDLLPNSTLEVTIYCDVCGKQRKMKYCNYNRNLNAHDGVYICDTCVKSQTKRKLYPKEKYYSIFLDFCNKNGYIPISTIDDYTNVKCKLTYECPKHGLQTIIIDNIKENSIGCSGCLAERQSKRRKLNIEDVIKYVESRGNKLLNPEDYIDCNTNNLIIECGNCHNTFTTSLSSQRTSANGECPTCGYEKSRLSKVLTIEDLNLIYNKDSLVLLNPEEYVNCSTLNLKFVCSECGEVFITSKSNYDYGHTRCQKCSHSKSKGEILIEEYLKSNNIDYIYSYPFDDCRDIKPLPFDFYLPTLNILIEFDGQQHYLAKYGEQQLLYTQKHDKMKTEYAKLHNIKLIRIPYWEGSNIDSILDKEININ